MQNTILDLLSWSKFLRLVARRITSIEARENLVDVGDQLEAIAEELLEAGDFRHGTVNPADVGQALLRLWRVTHDQEWRFSTLNVLGDESNQVSLILSLLRDTAENLLREDYINPSKPLVREEIEESMNPIGMCRFCKRVIETRAGFCPLCRKQVEASDVLEVEQIEEKKLEFIQDKEIDFEQLAPSTLFLFNPKNKTYECRKCSAAPFLMKKTRDPQCRDLVECPTCGARDKGKKGPVAFVADRKTGDKGGKKKPKGFEQFLTARKRERGEDHGLADAPWPLEGGDPGRSGFTSNKGAKKGKIKWSVKLTQGLKAAPVVDSRNNVYVGAPGAGFLRFKSNGKPAWIFRMRDRSISSALVDSGGNVYFNLPGKTYRLNPDGTPRWMIREGSNSPPVMDSKGNIYIISGKKLVSVEPDRDIRWCKSLGEGLDMEDFNPMPVVSGDDTIYVAVNHLLAFSSDGKSIFKVPLDAPGGRPTVGTNGVIYLGCGNKLISFKRDGTVIWKFEAGDYITTAVVFTGKGEILFGDGKGVLYCLNSSGGRQWSVSAPAPLNLTPSVDGDGNIYYTAGNSLYCLDRRGKQKWAYSNRALGFLGGAAFNSTVAIGGKGLIYVTCDDGKLYAFE